MSNPTELPDLLKLPRAAMLVGANLESLRVLYTEAQMREYAKQALARRAQPEGEAPQAEPVGEAGTMPGTAGFTMACFKATDVPIGTKLYVLKDLG